MKLGVQRSIARVPAALAALVGIVPKNQAILGQWATGWHIGWTSFSKLPCSYEIGRMHSDGTDCLILQDEAYRSLVHSHAAGLLSLPVDGTLAGVLPRMRGAPPEILVQLFPELAAAAKAVSMCEPTEESLEVEPHPLDYDWRFDQESVSKLTTLVGREHASAVLMGVPTLVEPLKRIGRDVVSLDRNPAFQNSAQIDFRYKGANSAKVRSSVTAAFHWPFGCTLDLGSAPSPDAPRG